MIGVVAAFLLAGCNDKQRWHEQRMKDMAYQQHRWLTEEQNKKDIAIAKEAAAAKERVAMHDRELTHEERQAVTEAIHHVVDKHTGVVVLTVGGVAGLWVSWLAINGLYFRFEAGRERRGRYMAACKLIESLPDCSEKRAAIAELAKAKSVLQLGHDERGAA